MTAAEKTAARRAAAGAERPHEPTRGLKHPMHPQVQGSVIGMVGATFFMLISLQELPAPWPTVGYVLWACLLGACFSAVFLRRRHLPILPPPASNAGLVYGVSTLAMVALIVASPHIVRGLGALTGTDGTPAQPAIVVLAVGLHFLPFATAFRAPVFGALGGGLAVVGLLGAALGLFLGAPWGAAAAVVAGALMLVVMTADAFRLS